MIIIPKLLTFRLISPLRQDKKGTANSLNNLQIKQVRTTVFTCNNGQVKLDYIKEKIFQPFFTTKPTGQGTGLGLSLHYDNLKVHGRELEVERKEGEMSEFVISLPL